MARARPPEVDFRSLDPGSYAIGLPGGVPTRVTTDPAIFEFSSDTFSCSRLVATPSEPSVWTGHAERIAGGSPGLSSVLVQTQSLWVATRFGPRTVGSFEELLAALHVIGEPCDFPLADWPGVHVSLIA